MEELGNVVREELAKAAADLDALVRQRDGVQARIEQLQIEVAGLQRLAQKYSPNGSKGVTKPNDEDWVYITRTEAVERVLRMAETPLSIREIVHRLQQSGRAGDTQNGVSGVLSRLKGQRRAHPFGKRGFWVWAENALQESTPETEERPDEVA